jgi:hypothetical protein
VDETFRRWRYDHRRGNAVDIFIILVECHKYGIICIIILVHLKLNPLGNVLYSVGLPLFRFFHFYVFYERAVTYKFWKVLNGLVSS